MFVETIPAILRDPAKPEDALKGEGDHLGDALRYVCMAVGTYAQPVFYDEEPYLPPEEDRIIQVQSVQGSDSLFGGFGRDLSMSSYLEGRD